jgi:hypothetical protein
LNFGNVFFFSGGTGMELESELNKNPQDLLIGMLLSMDITDNPLVGYSTGKGFNGEQLSQGLNQKYAIIDAGSLLDFEPMKPKSSYTFDVTDGDRLFAADYTLLPNHPAEMLGECAEMIIIVGDEVRWNGFRKINKRPRGVCSARGTNLIYYERHYRVVKNKSAGYYKRLIAFDEMGDGVNLFKQNAPIGMVDDYTASILCCSVMDDAHRKDSYLCSIKEGVELLFPVSVDDVFDLFSLRDGPLSSAGKRKALIHWVSSHLRKTKKGTAKPVKSHYRGITTFEMDGLTVRIEPNKHALEYQAAAIL